MKKILYIIFCLLISLLLPSQDSTYVRQLIHDLSSKSMYGRGYSYNGDSIAADYIRQQFIQNDVKPLNVNYYQPYSFNVSAIEGNVSFKINNKELNPYKDYIIAPYSHSVNKKVNIITANLKILSNNVLFTIFCDNYKKQLNKSFIYIDIEDYNKSDVELKKTIHDIVNYLSTKNPFNSLGLIFGVDDLPVWSFNNTDFERNYAVIYVNRALMNKDIRKASIKINSRFYLHHTQNVCGYITGSNSDSLIVFTAHYDHIGSMGDEVIFPGAHDNASGTSAVLDYARYFSKNTPKYTTVFILMSGEEAGLRGSKYFVQNSLIKLDKVKLLINIDLFCGGDDGITVVNAESPETKVYYDKLVAENNANHYLKEVKHRNNAPISDHYPFSQYCPAIFIYTMGGRAGGYHNYTDTCENCGLNCYDSCFKLLLELTK